MTGGGIANAAEAIETLRHRRTGEVLPTKRVARNTQLVYYADELVGLKLHHTVIAMYKPGGVVIDVRGPGTLEGWFTNVTWDRISSFTPLRSRTERGLRLVCEPDSWERAGLYAHGLFVNPDGSCEFPLDAELQRAIERIHRTYPGKLHRYADRIVDAWEKDWAKPLTCCTEADADPETSTLMHTLSHFEAGEVCVPPTTHALIQGTRATQGLYGEELLQWARQETRKELAPLTQAAIKTIAPEFPYPQATRK